MLIFTSNTLIIPARKNFFSLSLFLWLKIIKKGEQLWQKLHSKEIRLKQMGIYLK